MIKMIIFLLLAAAASIMLIGCFNSNKPSNTTSISNNQLQLTIVNTTNSNLPIDIMPGNTNITPMLTQIHAQKTANITITADAFGSTTCALNIYNSPAKMQKKVIIAVKSYQVYLRQCSRCQLRQTNRNHAQIIIK
jgi:hypothetical protein